MVSEEDKIKYIKETENLVYWMARQIDLDYEQRNGFFVELDDMIGAGFLGLTKALNTYDENVCEKFSSYAAVCIKNEILHALRTEHKNPRNKWDINQLQSKLDEGTAFYDARLEIFYADGNILEEIVSADSVKHMEKAANWLEGKYESYVINSLFGLNGHEKKTQDKVAEELNISQAYVSKTRTKALVTMREIARRNLFI